MERGRPLARSFCQEPVDLGLGSLDVFRVDGVLADQRLRRRGAHRGFRVVQRGEQRVEGVVARRVGEESGSHLADARIGVGECRHQHGPDIGRGLEAAQTRPALEDLLADPAAKRGQQAGRRSAVGSLPR